MSKLLIFGGTTKGRALAEFCSGEKIEAYVSTATEYGGRAGGFPEKVWSARKCGVKLIIIKRPVEQGISIERAKELISAMRKKSSLSARA